jgi:pimeloyl-ACP methyl ester carboxylesterase
VSFTLASSGPPAPIREPAPVIALHCSGSSGRQWRALQEARGAAPVHAPDLIGSGSNPAWSGERPFDLSEEAGPILEAMRQGGGPAHLVGHSYGGAVALHVALREPALVASLTLYEPSAFHVLKDGEADARQAYREIAGVASACVTGLMCGDYAAAAERFMRYWGGPDAWNRLKPEARRQMLGSLPTFVLHFRALLAETTRLTAFANLRMPTLLLRGERSPMAARQVTECLARAIPGAERRVLPGADHMAPLGRAEDVAALIAAYQHGVEACAKAGAGQAA